MLALQIAIGVALALGVAYIMKRGVARRATANLGGRDHRIDPFALREPWRFHVSDALKAQRRFAEAVSSGTAGPMQDHLSDIGRRIDDAVEMTWEVAQRGQELHDAHRSLDPSGIAAELGALLGNDELSEAESVRKRSLEAQSTTAARIGSQVDSAMDRLDVIDAQLDEAVARATELAARVDDNYQADVLASDVEGIVERLEALRAGLRETPGLEPGV